jgi:hypothetical protein
MPSLDQIFPYVHSFGQRATDSGACEASAIILVVTLTARIASRSLMLPLSREYSTFSWTVVRLRRMAYWWRIVKLSVIRSFLPQGSSSIVEFATNTT